MLLQIVRPETKFTFGFHQPSLPFLTWRLHFWRQPRQGFPWMLQDFCTFCSFCICWFLQSAVVGWHSGTHMSWEAEHCSAPMLPLFQCWFCQIQLTLWPNALLWDQEEEAFSWYFTWQDHSVLRYWPQFLTPRWRRESFPKYHQLISGLAVYVTYATLFLWATSRKHRGVDLSCLILSCLGTRSENIARIAKLP